jgi:hypothetical protein
LLKAADYAAHEGLFDPPYPVIQNHPALLRAKIETPALIINAESGEPSSYALTAVDNDGVLLERMSFNSAVNASNEEFAGLQGFALPGIAHHFIAKHEAAELIQSQFPDDAVSEPMAIENLRLDDDPYSHKFFLALYGQRCCFSAEVVYKLRFLNNSNIFLLQLFPAGRPTGRP